MDLRSVILAPIRVPVRIASALDDLADIAERARRDPDPVEQALGRLDAAVAEIQRLVAVAERLDSTGRDIHDGGQDLTAVAKALEADTRKLIDGGQDLTAVSERIEADLDTVADTVEPLQGAAERVGRMTSRLPRRRG